MSVHSHPTTHTCLHLNTRGKTEGTWLRTGWGCRQRKWSGAGEFWGLDTQAPHLQATGVFWPCLCDHVWFPWWSAELPVCTKVQWEHQIITGFNFIFYNTQHRYKTHRHVVYWLYRSMLPTTSYTGSSLASQSRSVPQCQLLSVSARGGRVWRLKTTLPEQLECNYWISHA